MATFSECSHAQQGLEDILGCPVSITAKDGDYFFQVKIKSPPPAYWEGIPVVTVAVD